MPRTLYGLHPHDYLNLLTMHEDLTKAQLNGTADAIRNLLEMRHVNHAR